MKKLYSFLVALMLLGIPAGMWGQTKADITDVIDNSTTSSYLGNTATTTWANFTITGTSGAEYYIRSMGTKNTSNALQWNANGYLYMTSTCDGYKLKSITITTTTNKSIGVYAQNSAYSAAPSGSALTTLSATSSGATYNFISDYTYLALKGTASSTSITNITIVWEKGSTTPTYNVTYVANGGTGTMTDSNSPYEEDETVTLLTNAFTAPEGQMFDEWLVEDADGQSITINNNTFTMPASNVTVTAQWKADPSATQYEWVETPITELTTSDVFVIVGNNGSNYAMSNNNGTSAPSAVSVTISGNKITSTVASTIQWNISGNADDGYSFYPNGLTDSWLYCTDSNNGVKVGNNNNKTFSISNGYLYNKATSRYVGIYNSTDWRCYQNTTGNIANQSFAFYKKIAAGTVPPSITAADVNIAFDATSGSIAYTINDEPTPAGTLTAAVTDGNWLTLGQGTTSPIAFTCTANEATDSREGVITLTYTYGNDETVTKDVTVTQAAAPVIYTTIPALFDAATSTETPVYVTFNNWVVSGVSTNGKNVFVTDNNGNGFVIYSNSDVSSTYAAGNILSGTAVSCTLKMYNGFAELVNVDANDLTITTGGTVTVANVDMADLAGVNTGALLHYDNLTCSVDNNKYYLSDGTKTLQVYNALFAFDALEDGKIYNITGIYQQYNSTKEILPRSAADIEEVEVQHNQYTLTVQPFENLELITFVNDEMVLEGDGEIQVTDGDHVMLSVVALDDYVMETLMVNGVNHVNDIADDFTYTFDMPAENVTISATAVEYVPPTGDEYVLYTGELVEGDYLIVYDGGAMNTTVTNDRLQYEDVTVNNDVIVTDNAAIVWHIAPSGDYWTIYNADADAYAASTGAKNKAQMLADGTDDKALWTVSGTETYEFVNKKNTDNNVNANLRKNGTYGFACYANTTGGALSLYKKVEATPATETFTLDIAQYTSKENGWYLIASPVSVDLESNTMVSGTYDLYRFNPTAELEWENYKNTEHTDFTTLEVSRGYLYANGNDGGIQLSFSGVPANNGEVTAAFTGWNLIGNPFGTAATVDKDYYRMNDTHNGIMTEASTGNVAKMEGIFVNATEGETITFTPVTEGSSEGKSAVEMNISQNRGGVIDRAIVRFGNSNTLPKFQLFENSTKIYFAQNGEEYAILGAEPQGEMPVSFKAGENGSYTLSVNTTEVEMSYLHLIDNLTGADIDLLSNPSYTFNAQTGDNATRFRLVFNAKSDNENIDEPFAFVSDGQIILTDGDAFNATVQVIDMMGRVLDTQNGVRTLSTLNMTPGVYVLRLLNGNTTRTQKIVVE